jgi:hypothetical protein
MLVYSWRDGTNPQITSQDTRNAAHVSNRWLWALSSQCYFIKFRRTLNKGPFRKIINNMFTSKGSQNSAVGIATCYVLDGWGVGVQVPVGARFFSSPCHPHWFLGPPIFLSNGYRGMKLTTHLQLVLRSRIHGSIHPLPHTSSCHSA